MEIRSFPIQRNGDGGSFSLANNPAEMNEKTLYICPSEIRGPRATLHRLESLLVLAHGLMMAIYDGIVKSCSVATEPSRVPLPGRGSGPTMRASNKVPVQKVVFNDSERAHCLYLHTPPRARFGMKVD